MLSALGHMKPGSNIHWSDLICDTDCLEEVHVRRQHTDTMKCGPCDWGAEASVSGRRAAQSSATEDDETCRKTSVMWQQQRMIGYG